MYSLGRSGTLNGQILHESCLYLFGIREHSHSVRRETSSPRGSLFWIDFSPESNCIVLFYTLYQREYNYLYKGTLFSTPILISNTLAVAQ